MATNRRAASLVPGGQSEESFQSVQVQVQGIYSELGRCFTDFTSTEPVSIICYLCFPFEESIDVDCIASKAAPLFHLDTCAGESEILTL